MIKLANKKIHQLGEFIYRSRVCEVLFIPLLKKYKMNKIWME